MLLLLPSFMGVMLTGCSGGNGTKDQDAMPAIDLTALDTTVNPAEDFYLFANGGWMKNNPLPPTHSRYGSFDVLRERSIEQIRDIVEELADKKQKEGTNEYRVAVLYKQAMDSTTRNELGATPVKKDLEEIEAIANKQDLPKIFGKWEAEGRSVFFGTYVAADDMNSTMNIMHVSQPSLALGNREYYLSAENAQILEAYNKYINKVLTLAGYSKEDADRITKNNAKISRELAQMSYSQEELRDSRANYHFVAVKEFAASHKGFDWNAYLAERNLSKLEKWDVTQYNYFDKFDKWFPTADLREIKDYLIASEVDGAASYLSDDFSLASFEFYGKTLSGSKEQHPRWRRSVNLVNGVLGEALGEVYVKRHFSPESKEKMAQLVKNLQVALGERIASLDWMSDATKAKAQEKLNAFTVKIGYPDKWRDYSKLAISADKSFYENLKEVTRFEQDFNMSELGKPVDRERWLMNPQDVNAYYMPTTNEICFPAGILQPPFFNPNADDAVNYGAIGVVIGHEMTHGFDDQGRNYDKDGNMNDWWTSEDAAKFQAATAKLVNQFNALTVVGNVKANGALTLGENIADQGGLIVAHLALQKALEGKEVPMIDGFTAEQRFFIGYARVWGQNITEQEMIRLTNIDPHSLGMYRVNQTLRNIDAFFKAFGIKEGDKMYLAPEDRVLVW